MAAGDFFYDPVTQIRTVKVTASGTPADGEFCTVYATQGLQISQAWGPKLDTYTLVFTDTTGKVYLCDYSLGGTTSSYRAAPGGAGRVSFSRLKGRERQLYVQSGSRLDMYDTASGFDPRGGFSAIPWHTDSDANCWLQLNQNESWATATTAKGRAVTAVNTASGAVITQTLRGIDEIYSGYNNVALINCDRTNSGAHEAYVWDLDNNKLKSIGLPFGGISNISHCPSMRGFWVATDTGTGAGRMPLYLVLEDGSHIHKSNFEGYYGQWHACGHWKQAAGFEQYVLYSMWGEPAQGWSPSFAYALTFVRCDDGRSAVLGHHYSTVPALKSPEYWSQPRATQSTDGRIVMFGSNMLNQERLDLFLMEVPVS